MTPPAPTPEERAEVVAAIRTGFFNRPFSRCSFCGKDWNGGDDHGHAEECAKAEADGDFIFIHENKGGTVGFDPEQAVDAVLPLIATTHARGRAEGLEAAAQAAPRRPGMSERGMRWEVQMRGHRGRKWWPCGRFRTRRAARWERHARALANPDDRWRVVAIRAGREGRG